MQQITIKKNRYVKQKKSRKQNVSYFSSYSDTSKYLKLYLLKKE